MEIGLWYLVCLIHEVLGWMEVEREFLEVLLKVIPEKSELFR